jgi:glycine cleavage system protein P-like pyridoxal-binding family
MREMESVSPTAHDVDSRPARTNPASAHLGFTVKTIRSTADGFADLDHLRSCALTATSPD